EINETGLQPVADRKQRGETHSEFAVLPGIARPTTNVLRDRAVKKDARRTSGTRGNNGREEHSPRIRIGEHLIAQLLTELVVSELGTNESALPIGTEGTEGASRRWNDVGIARIVDVDGSRRGSLEIARDQ